MWISSREWDSINKRLIELERVAKLPVDVFEVYDQEQYANELFRFPFRSYDKQYVSLKEAITKIMTHLGLKFEYVKGQPPAVNLRLIQPEKKKG